MRDSIFLSNRRLTGEASISEEVDETHLAFGAFMCEGGGGKRSFEKSMVGLFWYFSFKRLAGRKIQMDVPGTRCTDWLASVSGGEA